MRRRHRPAITLVQVPVFSPEQPAGGAEVIAVAAARALAKIGQVTVLHGAGKDAPAPGDRLSRWTTIPGVAAVSAFPVTPSIRDRGVIAPQFTDVAQAVLEASDVVLTIERALRPRPDVAAIASLGGSAYAHCKDVMHSDNWDRLVVPSTTVRDAVAAARLAAQDVVVIPNGVDTALFRPANGDAATSGALRLLLPSRPEREKGHLRAVDVVHHLASVGVAAHLTCLAGQLLVDASAFIADFRAAAASIPLTMLPWQPYRAMPALYRAHDVTLCLSQLPEGFGLTVAESILCGVPVVATRSGFVADMLPAEHGLFLVDPDASSREVAQTVLLAADAGRRQAARFGRPQLARHFGLAQMQRRYEALAVSVLDAQRSGLSSDVS